MSGKRAVAPCGHLGIFVIGQYIQCPLCDKQSVPVHVDPKDEKTKPLCRHCGSEKVEMYVGWGKFTLNGQELWHCHNCQKSFTA